MQRLAIGVALALSLVGLPAHADEAEARAHLKKGVELFQKSETAAALQEFEAANRAHHSPAITYNIARAHEALGHAHSAISAYEAYVSEAGAGGELTSAATLALAQLKAKCTRLQVVTNPSGARIRVDGVVIDETSPATVYVQKGKHNISVELDGWNDQKDFDSPGKGTGKIELTKPEAPELPKPEAPEPATPPPAATPETPKPIEPNGIMGGLALSLYGYTFVNKADDAEEKPTGFVFGLEAEVGYALSPNIAALLRVFAGLGSKEGSAATIGAGGPVLSFRVADDLWLGGGIIFGASQADATAEQQGEVTAETDIAFGPTGEISYAFSNDSTGQWLISILPGMLITTTEEESTIFVPLVIGHRWF